MKQPNNAVESSNKKHNGIIGFWKFMFYYSIAQKKWGKMDSLNQEELE